MIGESEANEDSLNIPVNHIILNNNSVYTNNTHLESSIIPNGVHKNGLSKSLSSPDMCDSNNGLSKSSSAPDMCDSNMISTYSNSEHYVRRESLRNIQTPVGMLISRRPSGHPVLTNRLSGRRITPGEVKRRTAFMDNNINRYNERLKKTDENMKKAIENMPLSKYE